MFTVMVAATPEASARAADQCLDEWRRGHAGGAVIDAPAAGEWPFRHPLVPTLPSGPVVVRVDALHDAFVNLQSGATRLVTTQALYLVEEWDAVLMAHGATQVVATADLATLQAHAPEVLTGRGAWSRADVRVLDAPSAPPHSRTSAPPHLMSPLALAFRSPDPAERLRSCVDALEAGRTASTLLATASVCMEVNDLDAAARDLDEAVGRAPAWAAAHFERGKLCLRRDDMPQAAESFRAAAEALPGFGSAWANLGATLGELDRPVEALSAFDRALAQDPSSHQALNNIGVVRRELGRLAGSETAFRQVILLAPDLAVGYYNLGHTLFLQGRHQAALSAYAEGQKRDAENNPVQASRLALCRVATGDSTGALRDLQRATGALPREYRRQLLADTSAILWALITQHPGLTGWQPVEAWVRGELARIAGGSV